MEGSMLAKEEEFTLPTSLNEAIEAIKEQAKICTNVRVIIPHELSSHKFVTEIIRHLQEGMSACIAGGSYILNCVKRNVTLYEVWEPDVENEPLRRALAPDAAYGAAEALISGRYPISKKLR